MRDQPVRVLVVGDPYFTVADFRPALSTLEGLVRLTELQLDTTRVPPASTVSEARLREYAGDPSVLAAAAEGHQVLVVHGAPVSAETLRVPGLRLVCCARGGPVNIDVGAATTIGIPICGTPGKNAEAVAELTIAFALMQIRSVASASADLVAGRWRPESVFDGRAYFGTEAASTTLGLVGFGQVGRQVARRAAALGFAVLAHDPYADLTGVDAVSLEDLLARSDIVSLHARDTADGTPIMGAAQFAAMRPGAHFINTAREQLVDEAALLAALRSGQLAGAALDVLDGSGDADRHPLLDLPQVVVTPHIGGATYETLQRGAAMAVASIRALIEERVPPHLMNPEVLTGNGGGQ
jgi:D-3-phosphoglycerate dehydrogenase